MQLDELQELRGAIDTIIRIMGRDSAETILGKRTPIAKGGLVKAKRVMSEEARNRIREAQNKRWAAVRAKQGADAKEARAKEKEKAAKK